MVLVVLVVLIVASALLPLTGLFGLLRLARRDVRQLSAGASDPNDVRTWPMQGTYPYLMESIRTRPRAVARDLILIGAGIVSGAFASFWSLFL